VRATLILNPADDATFRDLAEGLLPATETPEAFERALRERYPLCVVRPRALSDERIVVWYVYRDGHWIPRGEG
jgi:hypothetical protein